MMRAAIALLMTVSFALGSAGSSLAQSADMMGRHSMEGTVTRVDAKKGWVHVKTEEGTMIVHVPPDTLQGVKKGDSVTVDLAIKDNGPRPK
jgi:hypothetical protein